MTNSNTPISAVLRREWYVIVILCIPFILSWAVWDLLPDQVPIHFNIKGEADDWGPKWINAIVLPLLGVGLYLLLVAVPSIDPKNKIENKQNALRLIRLSTSLFMTILYGVVIGRSLGYDWNTTQIVFAATGLLFLLLGYSIKTVKPNYFMGVRTPWTLESEEVWIATHNWSSRLWIGGGSIIILSSLIPDSTIRLVLYLGVVTILAIGPLVYSFLEHRRSSN
jgi:uncharacterized membrane protein